MTSIPEKLTGSPLHQLSHESSGPNFLSVRKVHLLEYHKGKACPTSPKAIKKKQNTVSTKIHIYSDIHHVKGGTFSKRCKDITLTWLGCKALGPLTFRVFSNCGLILVIWPRHPIKDNLANTCHKRELYESNLREPKNHRLRNLFIYFFKHAPRIDFVFVFEYI